MLIGLDHLVIVVSDLDTARKNYEALGFTVVAGGRHPIGSHNALIAFEDGAYLELIAFFEPNPSHRWWARLEQGGGLVDFCMRTDDVAADREAFRRAGVGLGEPRPLSRVRPDGYTLQWTLAIPEEAHAGLVPFLIVDETPRDERVPRLRTHPNGARGIDTLTVAVPASRLPDVRAWYRAVLGAEGRDIRRDDLHGAGVRFAVGSHAVDLVAPAGTESPLDEWLRQRGGSPYAATLRAAAGGGALDPALAQGARLALG
ncbi:MAG TPA: VOC family protein [Gemmatimonadales bacterium]|nr:VOC family protein [Gemmatimonadales bacterium]